MLPVLNEYRWPRDNMNLVYFGLGRASLDERFVGSSVPICRWNLCDLLNLPSKCLCAFFGWYGSDVPGLLNDDDV